MIRIVNNIVAITDEDEIRICWTELDPTYVPGYKRYKPRDIATEVVMDNGLLRRPLEVHKQTMLQGMENEGI